MRRGFKSEAERLAVDIRSRLGCGDTDPAPLEAVAAELDVEIIPADDLVARSRLEELESLQSDAFWGQRFDDLTVGV